MEPASKFTMYKKDPSFCRVIVLSYADVRTALQVAPTEELLLA
jgi:hypothetical protein